jgi:hypothetical protein
MPSSLSAGERSARWRIAGLVRPTVTGSPWGRERLMSASRLRPPAPSAARRLSAPGLSSGQQSIDRASRSCDAPRFWRWLKRYQRPATPPSSGSSTSREWEASEAALRSLIRDLDREREVALARVQENHETLQQFWEEAGSPRLDALSWSAYESEQETASSDKEIDGLSRLRSAFARLTDYPELARQVDEKLQAARAAFRDALQQVQACLATIESDAEQTVDLLAAADRFFVDHPDASNCPLCESGEQAVGLADKVRERLEHLAALQNAQAHQRARLADGQALAQERTSLQERAGQDSLSFEQCRAAVTWLPKTSLPTSPAPTNLTGLATWLASAAHLPSVWEQLESIRLGRQHQQGTLRRAVATARQNTGLFGELDALIPRLQRTLKLVEDERRHFTDVTLATIAADVGRLYEAVHPGEGLNRIQLALDPTRRASLAMGADFGRQPNAPPQAYFSDSHLDTLGLCIFLAMAELDDPAETVLVLDDVLASVDESHAERLIEMLCAEIRKFRHCVLTTHYRPWRQKLRGGWLPSDQCQFIELTRWTASDGLTVM